MNLMDNLGLVIETSIQGGSLSIFERRSGTTIATQSGNPAQSRAEDLLENLSNLLRKLKLNKQSINLIILLTGAGSLTGLKIGEATAKGLASSFDCTYQEISLWDVFAENTKGDVRIFYIPVTKNYIARRIMENEKFEKNIKLLNHELFKEDLTEMRKFQADANLYIHEGISDFFDETIFHSVLKADLVDALTKLFASDNKKIKGSCF